MATLKIPAILLEGDSPTAAPAGGTGRRYALGPPPSAEQRHPEGELPDAYGTQQLLLAARDPHWLYAHWDLTREQLRRYNAQSADRHLILRIYCDRPEGRPVTEIHVHPESRHWFVHVPQAGTKYVAQLGYFTRDGTWKMISLSNPTMTPPDQMSSNVGVQFSTIPFEPLQSRTGPSPAALAGWRAHGDFEWPYPITPPPTPWTPAQEQALADVISQDAARRFGIGSIEIVELARRQLARELASLSVTEVGPAGPSSLAARGVSSPLGAPAAEKGFWFSVNADLIVYGATEQNATVTIGGRTVKLQPDGSFSCRFTLPDGQYELPVVAVSADQTDGRAAELRFSRYTELRGDVETHAPDPALGTPGPATG